MYPSFDFDGVDTFNCVAWVQGCKAGPRSSKAVQILGGQQYQHLINVVGGFTAWEVDILRSCSVANLGMKFMPIYAISQKLLAFGMTISVCSTAMYTTYAHMFSFLCGNNNICGVLHDVRNFYKQLEMRRDNHNEIASKLLFVQNAGLPVEK